MAISSSVLERLECINSFQATAFKGSISSGTIRFLLKQRRDSASSVALYPKPKSGHGPYVLQQPFLSMPQTMSLKAPSCRNHVRCLCSSEKHSLTQEETQVFLSDCMVAEHGNQSQQPGQTNGQQISDRVINYDNQKQRSSDFNGQHMLEDNVFSKPNISTLRLPEPEFENTFENTNGGKRIYFKGIFYDAMDPIFLRMRNENMINALERLQNLVEPSSTYDARAGMQVQGEDYPTLSNECAAVNSRVQPIFEKDNDFYRPYDFTNNSELQEKLGKGFCFVYMDMFNSLCIPCTELVAVDTSLILALMERAWPSSLSRRAHNLFSNAQCGFVLCESVILECGHAMRNSRFGLKGTISLSIQTRLNPFTGLKETGSGWTKEEYDHNSMLVRNALVEILAFTEGWLLARSEGSLAGVTSIINMHFDEGCQLFDARIFHEAWEYCSIIFSRDHHKVVITGKREGKIHKMLCINPLLMKTNYLKV